jgi:hypothetical protein
MSKGRAKRGAGNAGDGDKSARGDGPSRTEAASEERAFGRAEDRAEELLDDLGQRVGAISAYAAFVLRKYAARAREEAEDIWAEAQQLRRERRS